MGGVTAEGRLPGSPGRPAGGVALALVSLIAALSRFHPEVVERIRLARLRRANHENPNFRVGAYRDLARFQRVQVDRGEQGRRIYFAGPYRVGPRPEHALASGRGPTR